MTLMSFKLILILKPKFKEISLNKILCGIYSIIIIIQNIFKLNIVSSKISMHIKNGGIE